MKNLFLALAFIFTTGLSFAGADFVNQNTAIDTYEIKIIDNNDQIPLACQTGICEIHMPNGDGTFTVYKVCCDWITIQPQK